MNSNRFNTFIILDSIPPGDLNTARRLHEDLDVIAAAQSTVPGIGYVRIETEKDLFDCLALLRDQAEEGEVFPMLHLEAHGWEDGIQLADNSLVPWLCLKEVLIPLNIAMELNLMLVLGTCSGGAFAKALRTSERAPVWGLIGPTRTLSAGRIEADFGAFYRTLFSTLSPKEALEALNRSAPSGLYYRTTAEEFFYKIWEGYKSNYCSPEKLRERAKSIYRKAKLSRISPLPSIGQLRRRLNSQEPYEFNKFRDTYFMYDLFPSHEERFGVTYEKAEARAAG